MRKITTRIHNMIEDFVAKLFNREVSRYDDRGNLIYTRDTDSYEVWYTYDDDNNKIYQIDCFNNEIWYLYDFNNNMVYLITNEHYEKWVEYDQDNRIIHISDSDEFEAWVEYDPCRRPFKCKFNTGITYDYGYDDEIVIWYKTKGDDLLRLGHCLTKDLSIQKFNDNILALYRSEKI